MLARLGRSRQIGPFDEVLRCQQHVFAVELVLDGRYGGNGRCVGFGEAAGFDRFGQQTDQRNHIADPPVQALTGGGNQPLSTDQSVYSVG